KIAIGILSQHGDPISPAHTLLVQGAGEPGDAIAQLAEARFTSEVTGGQVSGSLLEGTVKPLRKIGAQVCLLMYCCRAWRQQPSSLAWRGSITEWSMPMAKTLSIRHELATGCSAGKTGARYCGFVTSTGDDDMPRNHEAASVLSGSSRQTDLEDAARHVPLVEAFFESRTSDR